MSKTQGIHENDCRTLIRLAHELHEIKGSRETRVLHFLGRLCTLLHAQVVFVNDVEGFDSSRHPRLLWWLHGGSMDENCFKASCELPATLEGQGPLVHAAARLNHRPGTYQRRQLVSNEDWYRSDFFEIFPKRAKLDDVLGAIHPVGPNHRVILLGAHRPAGDRPFGDREQRLLDIVNREFGWFLQSVAPALPMKSMPGRSASTRDSRCLDPSDTEFFARHLPRQLAAVLNRLVQSDSEKQIAIRLGLSYHTVHGYVKRLYRLLGVSSRAELMRLCLARPEDDASVASVG